MKRVKKSTLGGRWYAGDEGRLRAQVDGLLRDAAPPVSGAQQLTGLVVPHAGYMYSGGAAAAGYVCLKQAPYRRVVILAPSHYGAFRGVALLEVDAFETLLGSVPVDLDGVAALRVPPLFRDFPEVYEEEHSIEIQLPLLQRVLPGVPVVPVLIGDLSIPDYDAVAETLRRLADGGTVFVVSSDFVHYGRHFGYLPFSSEGAQSVREQLRTLDMGAIERVCAGDARGFLHYVAETGATICGRVPIGVFLTMARPTTGKLLSYYTSLDVTGDFEHSVSYATIAFTTGTREERKA